MCTGTPSLSRSISTCSPFLSRGPTMRRLIYVIKSAPPSLIFASARCKVGKSMAVAMPAPEEPQPPPRTTEPQNHGQSMPRSRSSRSDPIQRAIDRSHDPDHRTEDSDYSATCSELDCPWSWPNRMSKGSQVEEVIPRFWFRLLTLSACASLH